MEWSHIEKERGKRRVMIWNGKYGRGEEKKERESQRGIERKTERKREKEKMNWYSDVSVAMLFTDGPFQTKNFGTKEQTFIS